jgi:glutamate synthase domain-containing protein 3
MDEIRGLIEAHLDNTASPVAARILEDWSREQSSFWVISASGDSRSIPIVEQVEVPVSP